MSAVQSIDEQIGPDAGPFTSLVMAVCLALICAIGAMTACAIALTITFELVPLFASPYDQFRFIDDSSQFAAEAVGILVFVLAYRNGRGRHPWPRRLSILGVMKGIALFGVIISRFGSHLGSWFA